MIEYIGVKRFKTLFDVSFPLKQLNVFSGLNGMGKSSLIQVLLLLRQSHERSTLASKGLLLNGDYIQLGTGADALSINSETESINFILKWQENDESINFEFRYDHNSDLLPIQSDISNVEIDGLDLFNNNFRYLSADRVGPKSHHQLSEYHIRDLNSLGNHGEYTVHFIAVNGLNELPIVELTHENSKSSSLISNIEAWMSELTPGIKA